MGRLPMKRYCILMHSGRDDLPDLRACLRTHSTPSNYHLREPSPCATPGQSSAKSIHVEEIPYPAHPRNGGSGRMSGHLHLSLKILANDAWNCNLRSISWSGDRRQLRPSRCSATPADPKTLAVFGWPLNRAWWKATWQPRSMRRRLPWPVSRLCRSTPVENATSTQPCWQMRCRPCPWRTSILSLWKMLVILSARRTSRLYNSNLSRLRRS